jgi:PAB1-binding protein PBP1
LKNLKFSQAFVIDGVITKNKDVKEKELVPWLPDQNDQIVLSNSGDLESSRNGSWNQFEVNERKYGVKSSYNENLYTTELDKSSKFYKEHIKNAEQLAHEIETVNRS